jgi:hypothetical protein
MAASAAPPAEYEDDAGRIERDYISSGSTTEADVKADLRAKGFPASSVDEIASWLVSEDDAWDMVGEGGSTKVVDSGSVSRAVDRASQGTVSEQRARSIGDEVASTIDQARAEAARRVTDSGQVKSVNGQFGPSIQNAEEVVREDGIYFRSQDSGREFLAARFDR